MSEYQGIEYRHLLYKWDFTTLIKLIVKQVPYFIFFQQAGSGHFCTNCTSIFHFLVPLTCFHFWNVSLANNSHIHFEQAQLLQLYHVKLCCYNILISGKGNIFCNVLLGYQYTCRMCGGVSWESLHF